MNVFEHEYEQIFNVELKSLRLIVSNIQFEYTTKTLRDKRIEEWNSTIRNEIVNWIGTNSISSRIIIIFDDCFIRLWRVEVDKIHVLYNRKFCNSNQYRTNINDIIDQIYNIFIKKNFVKILKL